MSCTWVNLLAHSLNCAPLSRKHPVSKLKSLFCRIIAYMPVSNPLYSPWKKPWKNPSKESRSLNCKLVASVSVGSPHHQDALQQCEQV